MRPGRAVLGLALAALLTSPASAASLRTLQVDALSMRADKPHVAVGEVELECVEQAAFHLHGDARAALGILEGEEDRLPANLAPGPSRGCRNS